MTTKASFNILSPSLIVESPCLCRMQGQLTEVSQQLSDRASQPKTPAERPPNVAETWSQDDMAIIMHNLMKMMDKQNAREYKRAKKEEKRERSRSAKRKSRKEDSDDEQSVDIIGALAQFDLHVNVSRLPATKEIQACVRQARRAVKNGTLPTVGGRLDKRFVPSAQLSSEWAKALDPDRLRLMTFQTLGGGALSAN